MKLATLEDGITHAKYLLRYPQVDNSYIIHPLPAVNYGSAKDINFDYCIEKGLYTCFINRLGGTFVFNTGDLTYLHVGKDDRFNIKMSHFLCKKLQSLGIDAEEKDNDVLINGYKFMGQAQLSLPDGYTMYFGSITINENLDLINNICLKPMVKVPRGLSYEGINSELVEKWYLEFVFYFK